MSSFTTPASVVPSSSQDVPSSSIPSLDELRAWPSEPAQRVVIRGVDWEFYEQIVDSIPEGANIHVDYDGKDVELMALSALQDGEKKLFGQLVEAIAQELEIPYKSARVPQLGNDRRSRTAWNPTNVIFLEAISSRL